MRQISQIWNDGLWLIAELLAALLGGLLVHAVLFGALRRVARHTGRLFYQRFAARAWAPAFLLFPVVAVHLFANRVLLVHPSVRTVSGAFLIVALAWTSMRLVVALEDTVFARSIPEGEQPVEARKLRTRVAVLRRVMNFVIAMVALGSILMSIERLRQLGTGLLASAGIAGLVIGLSAQKTLGNLLAGIQIALAQPIRVGDAVFVEGEWGHIEDITLTYVVVCIWDLRRLVLPISYFMEKPFHNWTMTSTEMIGAVVIHVDYSVPVNAVRAELQRLVESSAFWDRKLVSLHVTDASDKAVVLRALVSASDSQRCWELRCEVREKLIAFLYAHHPECLPRMRSEMAGSPPAVG